MQWDMTGVGISYVTLFGMSSLTCAFGAGGLFGEIGCPSTRLPFSFLSTSLYMTGHRFKYVRNRMIFHTTLNSFKCDTSSIFGDITSIETVVET